MFKLSLCIFISSCVGYYEDMSHLSDDELEWINCYNVGDTVIFQSDNSSLDTLIVKYKKIENSKNRFFVHFIDNYMGDKYNAEAKYSYYIKGKSDSIDGRFHMTKLVENDSIKWSAYLGDLYSDDWSYNHDFERNRNNYLGENPIKVTSILFKGKRLDNCIIFNHSNSHPAKIAKEPNIERFVINKDYGLIYYRYTTGEEFSVKM